MLKLLAYKSRTLWTFTLVVLTTALSAGALAGPPLVSAVRDGDIAAVRLLLEQGEDANSAEGDGLSALHWAARRGEPEIAKVLLASDATTDAKTRNGAYTPLHEASKAGNPAVARVLLEAGADPGAMTTTGGATPLHFAAISGSATTVDVLLEYGAEIDVREAESGQTPLTWAAAGNHLETVSALLDGGADPEAALDAVRESQPGATLEDP